ncbi:Pyridine nucleotide-disulfide oxidoreductase [Acrodontium crateriforme]|uniref:Pyridine nucleotide-disulfide oxidoreductase n=1 Tax=Acrodontium crateriforme TaxID=150365 RepID=A0AAQ3R576_9PEZI|nr:Pyridine nucleotide-disulfide oxidoreductase [Acrodontium crateriforme]
MSLFSRSAARCSSSYSSSSARVWSNQSGHRGAYARCWSNNVNGSAAGVEPFLSSSRRCVTTTRRDISRYTIVQTRFSSSSLSSSFFTARLGSLSGAQLPAASNSISRSASTMSGPYAKYAAVVVGAGPAGVTCVGNLLERKVEPILWVDPSFNGGRVNEKYREVPSNTRVALFIDFATAVAPFRKIVSSVPSRSRWEEPSESDGVAVSDTPDKLQQLRQLEQGKGCDLSYAADMIVMLTEGLKRTPGVITQQGRVEEAILDEQTGDWTVRMKIETPAKGDITNVQAKRLVLCTGSSPITAPLPADVGGVQYLDLDAALSPTLLSQLLSPLGPTTVSVVGASHSAILVLRNLYNIASSNKPDLKIKWFTRHGLRYAEFMDGWILRDNTGLKGEVAVWAKANLEPEVFSKSEVSKYIEAVAYDRGTEKETFEQHMPGSDFVVQAIGYSRDPIPALRTTDGKEITPHYDHENGSFNYVKESECGSIGDLAKVPGLYGAGIAYPERVVDPHGNVEYAVGFFKFMKYVKKVSPAWN